MIDAVRLKIRIEELNQLLAINQFDMEDPSLRRSPSPEPVYDGEGKRSNTREQRIKNKLTKERQSLINEAIKINPNFKPPSDYKVADKKKWKKLYVPVKDYPEYNFIGLIIGPRGLTQKEMEKSTGTKIAVRGKGSSKEGKQQGEGADEELHVYITGDTDEQVEKASKLIEKILVPVEEDLNNLKILQLKKLAELNGTLRENYDWNPSGSSSSNYDQVCSNCECMSHPTTECPYLGEEGLKQKQLIDDDYFLFLKEINYISQN
eukprot:TRINITY_DN1959_c0_g1_i2.p1 TRINITY_DN1959_c0_g1~~TRINITY_DN1959_c0_g1_i2.p1  ORF type:complete len:263 (+),score=86.55 TRINITY_DN1959_c0_g1_i2:64-852(+)